MRVFTCCFIYLCCISIHKESTVFIWSPLSPREKRAALSYLKIEQTISRKPFSMEKCTMKRHDDASSRLIWIKNKFAKHQIKLFSFCLREERRGKCWNKTAVSNENEDFSYVNDETCHKWAIIYGYLARVSCEKNLANVKIYSLRSPWQRTNNSRYLSFHISLEITNEDHFSQDQFMEPSAKLSV